MELFKRDKAIEYLLFELDIPAWIHFSEPKQGIGPYDPNVFPDYETRRRVREASASEALHSMTDEELWHLHETPNQLKLFAREHSLYEAPPWYAGGFGVSFYEADFVHWSKMDYWTVEEAVCLSIGFKPEKMPPLPTEFRARYEALNFFWDRLSLAKRAPFNENPDKNSVQPSAFLKWALEKSLEVPPNLVDAVNANAASHRPTMLTTVDKRRYDSASKVILGLLASQFGYRHGVITSEMKSDIMAGLAELGISIDRKTLIRVLSDSINARERLEKEQRKRDDLGS